MPAESPARGTRVRDWLETTVESFNRAGLYFGHGSTNAYDEAAYLLLHTLKQPLDELDPVLERRLSVAEIAALDGLVRRRIAATWKPSEVEPVERRPLEVHGLCNTFVLMFTTTFT